MIFQNWKYQTNHRPIIEHYKYHKYINVVSYICIKVKRRCIHRVAFRCDYWVLSVSHCHGERQVDYRGDQFKLPVYTYKQSHAEVTTNVTYVNFNVHIPSSWTALIGFKNDPHAHNTNKPIVRETILEHEYSFLVFYFIFTISWYNYKCLLRYCEDIVVRSASISNLFIYAKYNW